MPLKTTLFKTAPNSQPLQSDLFLNLVFILFIGIILLNRVVLFLDLNLRYIDADQPIMWLALKNFAQGIFHEPRYYGQNYNTLMEALLAVPLFSWFHLPMHHALPLVTHFLFLFPFLFMAFYFFYAGKKTHAVLVLATVMCLPGAYDISNSISRGFVTGLFFTSFFILSIHHPKKTTFTLLNTLMAVTGYYVNPNSILVSVPLMLYLFICNYKYKRYYLVNLAGLLLAVLLYFFFDRFYALHPDFVVHGVDLKIAPEYFIENISGLNERLGHISFFFENKCWTLLLTLAVITSALFVRNKTAAWCFVSFLVTLLFMFSINKTLDGTTWPFFSYNRMYLGIPVVICLFFSFFNLSAGRFAKFLMVIPVVFSIVKLAGLNTALDFHSQTDQFRRLRVSTLNSTFEGINFYKKKCEKHHVNYLLLSNNFWFHAYLNYGGPAMYDNFPVTQETDVDRRYWIRESTGNKVFKSFILISAAYDFEKQIPATNNFILERLNDYGMYLVKENKLRTADFIEIVKGVENN
jgi:hypothetical protein